MDVGTSRVRVLLIRSLRQEKEAKLFGLTEPEQQGNHLCGSIKYVCIDAEVTRRIRISHRNDRISLVKARGRPDL